MRVAGFVMGMVAVAAAGRMDADPQATESSSVASVHDGMMLGGAIALGLQSYVDLRVGWMVNSTNCAAYLPSNGRTVAACRPTPAANESLSRASYDGV